MRYPFARLGLSTRLTSPRPIDASDHPAAADVAPVRPPRSRPPALRRRLIASGAATLLVAGALVVPSGITADPGPDAPVIVASDATVAAGGSITVDGRGFYRRQEGSLLLDAPTAILAPYSATGHGAFSVAVVIPPDAAPGPHLIVAAGIDGVTVATAPIEVVASGASPSATPSASPSPTIAPTPTPTPTATATPVSSAYTLDDEFDGASLGAIWGTSGHWSGLSEAAIDRSHTTVANGVMTISATRTSPNVWVSDTVDTYGRFTQTYGYFEARVRFSSGKGLWPAFWLAHDWTGDKSELDINETLANPYPGSCGDNSGAYYATVHLSDGSAPQGSHRYCDGTDLAGAWHVYGMDWRADHVSFFIDGNLWYTYTGSIPSTPLCVIFNLAVGGWAGASDSTTPSPSTMQVDWVHVRA